MYQKIGLCWVLLWVAIAAKSIDLQGRAKQYAALHPNTNTQPDPEYGNLRDGDIQVDKAGYSPKVNPFNAITDRNKLWTNNILYYEISDEYDAIQLALIYEGIRDLEDSVRVGGNLCVNLVESATQTNRVYVYRGGGCSSYLGMIGGVQTLSLADGCVLRHGTIMHEFLHALGFHHEQKRGDRDDFVTINWDNIRAGYEHNFNKLTEGVDVDHLGTTYDYGSVMHYGAYGFAIDSSIPTIIPHDPEAVIGQRDQLSALDIERVQIFYSCITPSESKYFKHLA